MLRGHVFDEQLFSSECFALFIDTFLAKNCGVIKGCSLSNSTNSVTVSNGFFCIRGRFLEIEGTDTLITGTDNAYCKLVCEIDLSKENTESELTQATLKIVKSTTGYPSLTQQDITDNGTVYQFEFAQFRTGTNGITEFVDTRRFLDFDSIYSKVNNDTKEVINQIKEELAAVEDGSAYVLKGDYAIMQGSITLNVSTDQQLSSGIYAQTNIDLDFPVGFNKDNCVVISFGTRRHSMGENGQGFTYGDYKNDSFGLYVGNMHKSLILGSKEKQDKIKIMLENIANTGTYVLDYKIVLMKIKYNRVELQKGDANGDGKVNADDLTKIKNFIMSTDYLTQEQFEAADMNDDGEVSAADYTNLKNQLGITD